MTKSRLDATGVTAGSIKTATTRNKNSKKYFCEMNLHLIQVY